MTGKWSDEEIEFLIENYPTMMSRDIARVLGRSIGAVRVKAKACGIKKYRKRQPSQEYEEYLENIELLNRIRIMLGLKPAKPKENPF